MKKRWTALALAAAGLIAASGAAMADVNVGVTISATGPAASLGIPQKNTIALMPHTIAGEKINYIVLDDASDTTAGVTNTRKLISENNVDIILGSSTTPVSLAMIDIVAESTMKIWDWAALVPIVEGAGGRVTGWNGETLTPEADGRILAVGDPALLEEAVRLLTDR